MYFSKITLCQNAASLRKLNQYIYKNGYYYHQLLWRLFSEGGNEKERDFIYRADFKQGWPNFYAVSATAPIDKESVWDIQIKDYQPKIKNGDNLIFMLRVNPRICRKNEENKVVYFDIIQDAFCQQQQKEDKKHKAEIIQEEGEKWLQARSERYGFTIKSVIADNFQKHQFSKPKQHNPICFSTLDYRGCLKVVDTEKFHGALMQGIGAAKSFGCGLLMVKR